MLSPRVEKTARQLRKTAELVAANPIDRMYVDPDDLGGMCGIASAALALRLRTMGFKPTLHQGHFDGDGHCWVVCQNHLVDITATQFKEFRNKPVLILPWATAKKMSYKTDDSLLIDRQTIFNDLTYFFRGWPNDQVPTVSRLRKLAEG